MVGPCCSGTRDGSTPRHFSVATKSCSRNTEPTTHENVDESRLDCFFGTSARRRSVENFQPLTLDGLRGRLLSSSYVPADGDPSQAAMLSELDDLFAREQTNGQVVIEYDTEIYFGQIA